MNYKALNTSDKAMKFSFKLLTTFLLATVIVGCANLSPTEKASFDEIKKLQAQFENSSDNALYHIKLGEEYEKLGKEKSSTHYYKKAINEYSKALELDSENTSLKFRLYQLTYTGVIAWFAQIEQLSALYDQMNPKVRAGLNPPHMALFQRETSRSSAGGINTQKLEAILYKALAENPLSPGVSYFMSNFLLDQGQHILSIDILKRSLESQPENHLLTMQLGIAYEEYANRDFCPYENQRELKKSLDLLQTAAKSIPNNYYLNYTLATLYERLNASILMVDIAKKLVEADPSANSKFVLAEALSNAGQLKKAELLYEELINNGIAHAYLDMATVYAENGQWEKSYLASDQYIKNKKSLPIYSALLHLAVSDILGKPALSTEAMSRLVDLPRLEGWERTMFDFWLGNISAADLAAKASNPCQTTESNFLVGVKKLNQSDKQSAKNYFQDVIDSQMYSFIEHRTAKHLVKMLDTN